jgi:hypothetical protein
MRRMGQTTYGELTPEGQANDKERNARVYIIEGIANANYGALRFPSPTNGWTGI